MVLDPELRLPTSDELPSSDDTPVDNEDQNFIPNLLLFLLQFIWANRQDWYFGVDMGIYHTTGVSPYVPVIPDGFLNIGVERKKGDWRKSYVVWEENGTVPTFVLEVASLTPGGEYDKKMGVYAGLGVLYYVIYNPSYWQRDRHQPFEVYQLTDGEYQLQIGDPFWMPEVGLGIGRAIAEVGGMQREILCWYNRLGNRYRTTEELAREAAEQLETQQQQLKTQQQQLETQKHLLERYRQQFGDLE